MSFKINFLNLNNVLLLDKAIYKVVMILKGGQWIWHL